MNSPEHGLRGSRHEYRIRQMLKFDFDQHTALSHEITHLSQSLEKSPLSPTAEVHIYEGVPLNDSGRKIDVTSSKNGSNVTNLELQMYGGNPDNHSIGYSYNPDLNFYLKTIDYSQNQFIATGSEVAIDVSVDAPDLEFPSFDDSLPVPAEALEGVLLTHAEKSSRVSHTVSKRYEYHDPEDLNADVIIHDINGNAKHFILDVYTHISKDGHDLLVAINYELEIDSLNTLPSGRGTLEVVAKNPFTKNQLGRFTDITTEEAQLYLIAAIKRMHTHAENSMSDINLG